MSRILSAFSNRASAVCMARSLKAAYSSRPLPLFSMGLAPISICKAVTTDYGKSAMSSSTASSTSIKQAPGPTNLASDTATIKEPISPLAKHLIDSIKINGPISVAQFMRQSLVHPLGGYYMKGKVFGPHGDFTTSPEISQMFGELTAVWFVQYWQSHLASPSDGVTGTFMYSGKNVPDTSPPKKFSLIELGPGRGTLMKDMLTTLTQLKLSSSDHLHAVHLVEASPELRKVQADVLGCPAGCLDRQAYTPGDGTSVSAKTLEGIQIYWHDTIDCIPSEYDVSSLIIAHEFFDAMPVYKFEKTKDGWRELVVDLENSLQSPLHFRFVRAPYSTKASVALFQEDTERRLEHVKIGQCVEIAPDVISVAKSIAQRVATSGGAALLIDYGRDHIIDDSLRGIKSHQFVHPLSTPGDCDLSADVDFSAISHAVKDIANPHGPVAQGLFLERMGIGARAMTLINGASTNTEREAVVTAYDRLVDPAAMGEAYKIMAITVSPTTPYALEPYNPPSYIAKKTKELK
ncbi:hypothetical protein BASA83_010527 [Batrachochytrium salamandrivorans]|nr:hypothetical protein BASA62_006569 [Batrachochytrium salamandrivorans]KAH9266540.1 hypothetical protein BASA83_010527 [Batrachochytrium salamandrivorans]